MNGTKNHGWKVASHLAANYLLGKFEFVMKNGIAGHPAAIF